MTSPPILFWFRRDLRLRDNIALHRAIQSGSAVLPLFIIDPRFKASAHYSPNRMAFLLASLSALDKRLTAFGSRLLVAAGLPHDVLPRIVAETGAASLYFNLDYTPFAVKRDDRVRSRLSIPSHSFDDHILVPPQKLTKDDGSPFRVFTPFYRRWRAIAKQNESQIDWSAASFHACDSVDSASALARESARVRSNVPIPPADESAAFDRYQSFIENRIETYADTRDYLDIDPFGAAKDSPSSALSHFLRLGILSPRQLYWAARRKYANCYREEARQSIEAWIRQLAWRDFFIHVMFHFPQVRWRNFRSDFDDLEWRDSPSDLQAWKDGRTGYPIVDAAMRQLAAIGWMPNRARMIVASFLTKDLLIDWRQGESHFMRHLLDGDQAANNGGWQWTAGVGTDAQPYFRVFNPILQSQRYDPDGEYIRHWIPELRDAPARFIHQPWRMNPPPSNYPNPIVDHKQARARAVEAFRRAKRRAEAKPESR